MTYDLIIVGSGTAGYTAAIYASRNNLKTLVIGTLPGGLGTEADIVENYPGFESISGMELMKKMENHAKKFGAETIIGTVARITKQDSEFLVKTTSKDYKAKAIILATGMVHRKLSILGEEKYLGKGVSYCFNCDGPFFKDKTVGVVGGSDSAVMAASFLSGYAKKVYVFYRKEKLRAEQISVDRLLSNEKIEVIYNVNLKEIKGNNLVSSVLLDNSTEIKLDGIFIEIGFIPTAAVAKELGVELNEAGFIIVDEDMQTNVEGVFAAGDITSKNKIQQYVSATAEGASAAINAYKYILVKK